MIRSLFGHDEGQGRQEVPRQPIPREMGTELEAVERRIEAGIRRQGRYYVATRAEMAQIGDPVHAEAFALWHGWAFVNHLNGENYEFFEARPGQELY